MGLKRAVITEELVDLTEDTLTAVILNQFLYWTVRRQDIDEYLDEVARSREELTPEQDEFREEIKTHGWIYKKAEELRSEIMFKDSEKTIRRRIKDLIERGYLEERKNPHNKWDRVMQYRVNLVAIEEDLRKLDHSLATVMGKDYTIVKDALKTKETEEVKESETPPSNTDNKQKYPEPKRESHIVKEDAIAHEENAIEVKENVESKENVIPERDRSFKSEDEENMFFQLAVDWKMSEDKKLDSSRAGCIVQAMIDRVNKGEMKAQDRYLMMLFKSGELEKKANKNNPTSRRNEILEEWEEVFQELEGKEKES